MINIYKYIYYRTYKWNLKKWGAHDVPQFKSMYIVSLIMFFNIITVGLLLQKISGLPFLKQLREITVLSMIGTGFLSYFTFVRKKKIRVDRKRVFK